MTHVPDPPVIGTDFSAPRTNPPGSVPGDGGTDFYGIRRFDVFQNVKGDNGAFNEWQQYTGVDFVKGPGCFDQYEEYSFPQPHTLYVSGNNEAGDRNYGMSAPVAVVDGNVQNQHAIKNQEIDCSAGQFGTRDTDAVPSHSIGARCVRRQDSNILGPSPAGHTNIPLGDPVANDVSSETANQSWALHVGSQEITFYENILYIRSKNYRQVFFQGKIFYPMQALSNSDHRAFEFQFLSHNYWVMYTPIGAGVYMLFVYQTIRNAAGLIVAFKQVLTSNNIFPQDTELDCRYFFISENYMVLFFKADIVHDPPDPSLNPEYAGYSTFGYKVRIYYRACMSDEFYPLSPEPIEIFNLGGNGGEIYFAHWQNLIMFYREGIRITVPAHHGIAAKNIDYPAKLYVWIDGEEVATTNPPYGDSARSTFASEPKTFSFRTSKGSLEVFDFVIAGAVVPPVYGYYTQPSYSRLSHDYTSDIFPEEYDYSLDDNSRTIRLSNYSTNVFSGYNNEYGYDYGNIETLWRTISHTTVDFQCTEQRYLETENYEIRLFTHVEDINTPIFDSLYFRVPLKETRYIESREASDTAQHPVFITTDSTQVTETFIQYAGSVFKPTWMNNMYAIASPVPHKFMLLRTDVKSLYYGHNPQYPDYHNPLGIYATLLNDTTVCVLRAPNDQWLYFRPPANITLSGATDLDKFKNLWATNSQGYVTAPSIISQNGDQYIIGYCKPFTTTDGTKPPSPADNRMALVVTLGSVESHYIDIQSLTADDPENPSVTGIPGKCCNFQNADGTTATYRGPCQELWDTMVDYNGQDWCIANLIDMAECECNDRGCIDPGSVQEVEN